MTQTRDDLGMPDRDGVRVEAADARDDAALDGHVHGVGLDGGPPGEGGPSARDDAVVVPPSAPTGPVGQEAERRRPVIERLGMAAIALVLAVLFGAVALAAFEGGEPFLGAMAGIGCLMTLWVGALTLVRG